jgi:hypothetical protein
MVIAFNTSVGLGGQAGDCTDEPSGFVLWEDESVQEDAVIGAVSPARFARGNRVTLAEWSVTRTHATAAAAELYMLTHPADLRGLGTLTMVSGATTVTVTDCRISMGKPTRRGLTTVHPYSARGVSA